MGVSLGVKPVRRAAFRICRLVEAPGIEPGSEAVSSATSTSVVPALFSPVRRPGTGSAPASRGVCRLQRRDATGDRDCWY
jgi:hypothetical protein